MPQARQYKDPLGSETWTGNAMVNAFGHACGGQRMLRGEQLYRTGKVMFITDIEVKTRDAKDTCLCQCPGAVAGPQVQRAQRRVHDEH